MIALLFSIALIGQVSSARAGSQEAYSIYADAMNRSAEVRAKREAAEWKQVQSDPEFRKQWIAERRAELKPLETDLAAMERGRWVAATKRPKPTLQTRDQPPPKPVLKKAGGKAYYQFADAVQKDRAVADQKKKIDLLQRRIAAAVALD